VKGTAGKLENKFWTSTDTIWTQIYSTFRKGKGIHMESQCKNINLKIQMSYNDIAIILTLSNSENAMFRALICATHSEEYMRLPMMYNKKTAK
jgi:hypothetical protein